MRVNYHRQLGAIVIGCIHSGNARNLNRWRATCPALGQVNDLDLEQAAMRHRVRIYGTKECPWIGLPSDAGIWEGLPDEEIGGLLRVVVETAGRKKLR